jgi:polyisoprenyl-phosphate glycosyltransferase
MTPEIDVSVVVPVFRNRATLAELSRRLCAVFDAEALRGEIVFVNDACPEGSIQTLEELARLEPLVTVLDLDRNVGQHWAVLTGLGFARGPNTVILDADLQDPPEALPLLLDALRSPPVACVFAGRRGRYQAGHRHLTSRLFKKTLSLLTGLPPDAGIFLAMNAELRRRLLDFNAPQPFVVAMIGCTGLPVASIPVERSRRESGQSAYSSWKRLRTGLGALRLVLEYKRIASAWESAPSFNPARIRKRFGGDSLEFLTSA